MGVYDEITRGVWERQRCGRPLDIADQFHRTPGCCGIQWDALFYTDYPRRVGVEAPGGPRLITQPLLRGGPWHHVIHALMAVARGKHHVIRCWLIHCRRPIVSDASRA